VGAIRPAAPWSASTGFPAGHSALACPDGLPPSPRVGCACLALFEAAEKRKSKLPVPGPRGSPGAFPRAGRGLERIPRRGGLTYPLALAGAVPLPAGQRKGPRWYTLTQNRFRLADPRRSPPGDLFSWSSPTKTLLDGSYSIIYYNLRRLPVAIRARVAGRAFD